MEVELEQERKVIVNGKEYVIKPLSVRKIAAAAEYLSDLGGDDFPKAVEDMDSLEKGCKALSCFIVGDESIAAELSRGTLKEITIALSVAVKLLSVKDFMMLATLVKSSERLVANPRP